MNRQLTKADYFCLKAGFRRLCKLAGGVEAAAEITRVAAGRLSEYGNTRHETTFAPIDVVADLEAETGDTALSASLAKITREYGNTPHVIGDPCERITTAWREAGEAVEAYRRAVRSGDPQEIAVALKELCETDEAFHMLVKDLQAHQNGLTAPALRAVQGAAE